MPRPGHGDQPRIGEFVDESGCTLRGEQFAFFPPEQQERLSDSAQVGRRPGRDAEPTGVELEPPTPVLLQANREFRDPAEQWGIHASGGRDDAIAVDGLFPSRIGAPQGQGEASHPARSLVPSPGEIHENELARFGVSGRVIQGDLGPHGVPHQGDRTRAQVFAERLQIEIERAHFKLFRVIGVTVAAEIQRDHVILAGEGDSDMVPPMRIGTSAVEEDERGAFWLPPGEKVQRYSGL